MIHNVYKLNSLQDREDHMKNSSKLLCSSVIAASGLVAQIAQAEITANVALTTDYVWRGVSQNQEDPAVQGGIDYAHESGFYLGAWGANVSFGGASTELDLYAGWATEFDSGFSLDLGIIEYTYHGSDVADENDFTEYYVGLGYAGFGFIYSIGDEFDDQWELSYGFDFESISLGAAYGDYDAYSYYTIGISGEAGGLGLALDYWDTDSDGEDLFGDDADGRVVFTISKEF